jgi:hypothetical protein
VQPYFEERDLLAPDLGGAFWNTASGDCYVGISPRWFVDVWGDHNREGSIAAFLASLDFRSGELRVHPRLATFLRIYGITHLLSPYPLDRPLLPFAGRTGSAYVYRVDGSARVRFVSGARTVSDDKQAVSILLAADFDPAREIVLHDAPPDLGRPSAATEDGRATIVSEDQRSLVIQVVAPADGFLLVADTFYPGWTASVDGRPTAIYRANMSVRGLQVPAGAHEIRLEYEPPGFRLGLVVSITGLVLLALWLTGALWLARRVNGHLIRPIHGQ